MNRREFLKRATLAVLAANSPSEIWAQPMHTQGRKVDIDAKSRVLVAHHPRVTDQDGRIDKNILDGLLGEAVKGYTEEKDVKDAWAKLLYPFSPSDTFGIRVNCIAAKCPSRPELVEFIAAALHGLGIPEEHIIVWDRTGWEMEKAGYVLNRSNRGVQYYGLDAEGVGHDDKITVTIPSAGFTFPLGRLLSTVCDHIINVPVIKDHRVSGSTFSLKSAYAYLPLAKAIPRNEEWVRAMHQHRCDPQVAELNNLPLIRKKNRIVIGDALLGVYEGGPIAPANWRPNRLIIGKDMVATDQIALEILEAKRAQMNLPGLREIATYIRTCAQMGLGNDDPGRIEKIESDLG